MTHDQHLHTNAQAPGTFTLTPNEWKPSIQFGRESAMIFRITYDGNIELGEGASLDDASRTFWDWIEKEQGRRVSARTPEAIARCLTKTELIALYDGMKSEDILKGVEPGDHGNAILEAFGRRVIAAAVAKANV